MQHAASVAAQHVGIRGMYLYFPRMVVRAGGLVVAAGSAVPRVCAAAHSRAVDACDRPESCEAHASHVTRAPTPHDTPRATRAPQVSQADLEAADGVPGKYTAGLGQAAMGFTGDREDVVSMAATAVLRLLEGAAVPLTEVGRCVCGARVCARSHTGLLAGVLVVSVRARVCLASSAGGRGRAAQHSAQHSAQHTARGARAATHGMHARTHAGWMWARRRVWTAANRSCPTCWSTLPQQATPTSWCVAATGPGGGGVCAPWRARACLDTPPPAAP
jgi:hypothetical protein